MLEIILVSAWCGMGIGVVVGITLAGFAWRNGVTDGYGYAKEPDCPGYKAAGDYLKATMSHRWPELDR